MAVDTTVKTYRGTRAKKVAVAIKQLPTLEKGQEDQKRHNLSKRPKK